MSEGLFRFFRKAGDNNSITDVGELSFFIILVLIMLGILAFLIPMAYYQDECEGLQDRISILENRAIEGDSVEVLCARILKNKGYYVAGDLKMKVFVLEDDYNRIAKFKKAYGHVDLHIATTVEEARAILSKEKFPLMYLDHDLGGEQFTPSGENSGYAVAEYLATQNPTGTVIIHSCNTVGAERMKVALSKCDNLITMCVPFTVIELPFGG